MPTGSQDYRQKALHVIWIQQREISAVSIIRRLDSPISIRNSRVYVGGVPRCESRLITAGLRGRRGRHILFCRLDYVL